MKVIAHRGANKEAFENSWEAYERAIAVGADRIELDVHLTKEGDLVIYHDFTPKTLNGITAPFSALSTKDIRKFKLPNGEAMPFLDEVCERLLPRIELNIEIKGRSTELADRVGRLSMGQSLRDKIIVSCFNREPLEHLAQHFPEIKRACLLGADNLGWPYFAHYAPGVFLDLAHTNILHPQLSLITPNLMDQAKARGWVVYGWSPMVGEDQDREGIWSMLKTLEVDGFCTNYPRELRNWLTVVDQEEREWQRDNP